jgi:hypothetical protein
MRIKMIATAVLLSATAQGRAEDCEAPCMGTTVSLGIVEDWVFSATPKQLKRNSLQPEIGIESFIMPVENLKFVSVTTIEQVIDPEDGSSSTFENIGAYQSELYAELAFEPLTVTAGKFSPVFSLAADKGDGISASDLAGNVDVEDSLGATAAFNFNGLGHAQVLTGSLFTLDRSFLAKSMLTKREVPRLSDGGAGNTSGLSSASLVLDGCVGADVGDCHDDGDFGYRMGLRYQQHGVQTEEQAEDDIVPKDETAFLVAAMGNFDIGDNSLRLLGEASYINHFGSNPDDALIVTGIATYTVEDISATASLSHQINFLPAANANASLAELSILYSPESELGLPNSSWNVGAAYTYAVDEDDIKVHVLSMRLNLEFGGTRALR